jgi:tRNA A37 methylthiotransferase MiaB
MGFFDQNIPVSDWALIEAPIPNAPEAKYISQIPSPTNLLMLASALKQIGVKPKFFNFLKERRNIPIVKAPNIVYNLGEATCMDYLYNYAIEYLHILRVNNPKSNLILTGYHAWLHKEDFKNVLHTNPHYFESGVIGLKKTDDLWETEWPNDWSVNDWEWMKKNVNSTTHGIRTTIRASRGCPHNCRMCPVKFTYGKVVRRYSVNWVLQELTELYHNYKIRQIGFLDDNLLYDRKWAKTLLQAIIDCKFKDTKFTFEEGLDVPTALDEDIIQLLKQARFTHIKLGIESLNKETLDFIKKPYRDPDNAVKSIQLLQKYKMNPTCFICIGFPTDTEKSITDTINTLIKLKVKLRVQILWAYPGIDFANKNENLTHDKLKKLQKWAMEVTGSNSWRHKE